jgi:hypothetical protein
VSKELKNQEKINGMGLSLQHLLSYAEEEDMLNRIVTGVESYIWATKNHLGGKYFTDDEEVEMEVQKWLRQQSKDLLYCGFQCTGKAMGQVHQCLWRVCRKIIVFSRFEYHMFYILYPFVAYLLTLPHIS